MSRLSSNIILDEWFNKIMSKPINNRPGYDMKYVSAYIPRINKSNMAIWFDCWKLVKITDIKPKKTYFSGWRRYGYEIKSEDLMKYHWNNECSKAKTPDGSARLIQKAYRNYRKRPVLLAKQVWEAVRNDNTSREKKFLSMPSRDTRCTLFEA
ncbi:hypothetical protein RhiirB3_438334 [Rhizophagus irregularis]|nr:hypothetical protein RhiirB3_438334 [Rhizophagus irregularis]